MKTAWMIVASVTLAGCGLHGSSGATHEAPSGSELVAGGGPDRVAAPGIVEPWDGEVALAPPEAGWIAEIFVHEGERVRRGQTLATLDDAAQRAAVALARSEVAAAEAELRKLVRGATAEERRAARASASADASRAAFARSDASRFERLGERQATPRADVERATAEADAQTAVADASAARLATIERGARGEDRAIARARLDAARAGLGIAEADLARRQVTATVDGVVLVSRFHAGELFSGTSPMFVLGDLSRLRLRLEIDEIDATRVAVGAATEVLGDDNVPVTTGRVFRIAPRMGRRSLAQENPTSRADTRVREVFVELVASEGVVPGMRLWGYVTPAGGR